MAISTPSAPKPTDVCVGYVGPDGNPVLNLPRLMHRSFAFFYAQLRDDRGDLMLVEKFHEEWADYMQQEALLVLMAPRDHGKSNESQGYLMWKAWRHNRDSETGLLLEGNPDGAFRAVIFSDTLPQAGEWFEKLQGLILANADIFVDILPEFRRRGRT